MRAKWLPALVLLLCSALCFSAPADHPAPLPCAKVKNRPCIALVLGGGGARGGAHLGAVSYTHLTLPTNREV